MIFDKYRFVVFGILLISGSVALAANETCDLRSLDGHYEFSASGKTIPTKATDSGELEISSYELRNLTVTGTLDADGAGNVTIRQTRVSQGLPHQDEEILGTYTVNSDCTGKISFLPDEGEPPETGGYDFVLKQTGKLRFVGFQGYAIIGGQVWQTSDNSQENMQGKITDYSKAKRKPRTPPGANCNMHCRDVLGNFPTCVIKNNIPLYDCVTQDKVCASPCN